MEESLERELRRALRKEAFLSVLMADIDHFKCFNDTWGHENGDAVLRELARLFQSQLRAEDIACRYGGEEFLLVLPEADLEAAERFAERLKTAVRASQVQHYGKVLEGINLSIGIACYPQHATSGEALVHEPTRRFIGQRRMTEINPRRPKDGRATTSQSDFRAE
jgi:diguanylate cyclase (GGDEF)-like protein